MYVSSRIFKCYTTHCKLNLVVAVNLHLLSGFVKRGNCLAALHCRAREDPVIMKIDTPEFKALFTPELTTLASLFKDYGHEIRIAGGAVRDLLIGIQPHDLDFATTATPDQMKEMFTKEEVRMINMKGEKHGTITPRINNKENFEVTTLRIDVCTDGRHAEVQFTKDWKLDANRRDLTINSMFLGLDGTVYDYFNGYEDLQKRRVAFVGDPSTRIHEDYLRILRYFRFHGRIAKDPDFHEPDTLQAIQNNMEGLDRISGERIWSELNKILSGNHAGELMTKMIELGIGPHIGLPGTIDMETFTKVWQRGKHLKLHPITLLCSLLKNIEDLLNFHKRVKLSAFERDLGTFLIENRHDQISVNPLRAYQLLVLNTSGKGKVSDTQQWVGELLKYRGDQELLEQYLAWTIPRFPVNGNMLKDNGVPGGKLMGPVMQKLKVYWAEHDFNLTPQQILDHIPHVLGTLGLPSPQNKER